MDSQTSEAAPRKSLDEIAAMMAENSMKMRSIPEPQPNEVTDVDEDRQDTPTNAPVSDEAEGHNQGDQYDEPAVADDDSSAGDVSEDQSSDDSDDAAQNADDNVDDGVFTVEDDTVFQLDDETEVSFADLKKVYHAEKETAALLQKQEEAAQEALAERRRASEEVDSARRAAVAVFQHMEQLVATPMFDRPPESLKSSDPQKYIRLLDAFTQDQQRIVENRKALEQVFEQQLTEEKKVKESLKKQVIEQLPKLVPALASDDPEVRGTASRDILSSAKHYGFSDEEINEAVDPRLYQMAYDAEQYRRIMSGSKAKPAPTSEKEKQKTVQRQARTLRSGSSTAKSRQTAKARVIKQAKAAAKKSGKVDDVANLIATQRQHR